MLHPVSVYVAAEASHKQSSLKVIDNLCSFTLPVGVCFLEMLHLMSSASSMLPFYSSLIHAACCSMSALVNVNKLLCESCAGKLSGIKLCIHEAVLPVGTLW